MNPPTEPGPDTDGGAFPGNAEALVAALHDSNPLTRQNARESLVKLGPGVAPLLEGALKDTTAHVRWEAAKTLAEVADPAAAPRLVEVLGDDSQDVRWVAAEALIAIGRAALGPLLTRLTSDDDASKLYEGAHHVLHDLVDDAARESLTPLLEALRRSEPEVSVPVAAARALEALPRS
jgi:HEAT repeat protein